MTVTFHWTKKKSGPMKSLKKFCIQKMTFNRVPKGKSQLKKGSLYHCTGTYQMSSKNKTIIWKEHYNNKHKQYKVSKDKKRVYKNIQNSKKDRWFWEWRKIIKIKKKVRKITNCNMMKSQNKENSVHNLNKWGSNKTSTEI